MKILPDWLKNGYLRVINPVADLLVRLRVNPNSITTIGTLCSIAGGVIYATGHIMSAGWLLSITALFDVLDGTVARRTGRSTVFGAFYDSTLDRVADGAVMAGLTVFYATDRQTSIPGLGPIHTGWVMVTVCMLCIIGTYLTSYTRARAEALGIDAKVGMVQRPERVVLLCAPQALFGLALGGLVLAAIVLFLCVTAWITAVQRIVFVYRATKGMELGSAAPAGRAAASVTPSATSRYTPAESAIPTTAPSAPTTAAVIGSTVSSRPILKRE
jgi:CDP-diacylglycerol--glycerol-3-phosphate 3-phosphatidyltransferase